MSGSHGPTGTRRFVTKLTLCAPPKIYKIDPASQERTQPFTGLLNAADTSVPPDCRSCKLADERHDENKSSENSYRNDDLTAHSPIHGYLRTLDTSTRVLADRALSPPASSRSR